MNPLISVIVATADREGPLIRCISSLLSQTYANLEIIVVDQNRSWRSETESFFAAMPLRLRRIPVLQRNLPAARNIGAQEARGEIVIYVDDDCEVPRDFVERHCKNYEDAHVAAVSGKVNDFSAPKRPWVLFEWSKDAGRIAVSGRSLGRADGTFRKTVWSATGSNMSFRKSALQNIGGFDEGYVGNYLYEETDVSYRIRTAGGTIVYDPQCVVDHKGQNDGGCRVADLCEYERYRFYNAAYFHRKRMPKFAAPSLFATFLLIAVLKSWRHGWGADGVALLVCALLDGYRCRTIVRRSNGTPAGAAIPRKRMLFVIPSVPDGHRSGAGIHLTPYLKALSGEYEITLVSFDGDPCGVRTTYSAPLFCRDIFLVPYRFSSTRHPLLASWRFLRSLVTGRSYHTSRFECGQMKRVLRELEAFQPFDIVCAVDAAMGEYFKCVSAGLRTLFCTYRASVFYTEYARTAHGAWRALVLREAALLKDEEKALFDLCDAVISVSEADAQTIRQSGTRTTVGSVPVSIEADYFRPTHGSDVSGSVILVGSAYWYPNLDQARYFAREIVPRLLEKQPGAHVLIAGDGFDAHRSALSKSGSVAVIGRVQDIRPFFSSAVAVAVPVRICGGGVRTKILTALACGAAVVTTQAGMSGLTLSAGTDLLVADTPDEFASALDRLYREPELRRTLGNNGMRRIAIDHGEEAVSSRLLSFIRSLCSGTTPEEA